MAPIGRFLPVATGRFVEANLSIRAIMSNESSEGRYLYPVADQASTQSCSR